MKPIYRAIAFIIGALAIIGGIASIVVPAKKAADLRDSVAPQSAIVSSIDKPLRKGMQPFTIEARITTSTGLQTNVEVESYTYYPPGSSITIYQNPEDPADVIISKGVEWQSVFFSCIIIAVGVVIFGLAFLPNKAHESINRNLKPLARMSVAKPGLSSNESKWANAALVASLFNLTLVAAPVAIPLSFIFGLLAIRDIKKYHKSGSGFVIFAFVFNGLFSLLIVALIIKG